MLDDTSDRSYNMLQMKIRNLQMSHSTKRRVRRVDKSGGRCCISLSPGGVDFLHCVPRRFGKSGEPNDLIDRLEYWWNLERYSLNLDSRYNILPIELTYSSLLHRVSCLLVPCMSILDRYYESITPGDPILTRKAFPEIPNATFTYKLIAHPRLKPIAVFRQDVLVKEREIPRPETLSFHAYPFDRLNIQSHLHPRYAIYEAGRKLRHKTPPEDFADFEKLYPDIVKKVLLIYDTWCQPIPDAAYDQLPFRLATPQPPGPDDDGSDDDSEQYTPRHRIPPYLFKIPKDSYLFPDPRQARFLELGRELTDSDEDDDGSWYLADTQSSIYGDESWENDRGMTPSSADPQSQEVSDLNPSSKYPPLTEKALAEFDVTADRDYRGRSRIEKVREWYQNCDAIQQLKRRRSRSI